MDQSSNREGNEHGEGHHHHQHHFSYHQQQQPDFITSSSSSKDHGSPSHSQPQTRDWFAAAATSQPSTEDKINFLRSSYNFMKENEEDKDEIRGRLEHDQHTSSSSYFNSHSSHYSQTLATVESIEKVHMFDKVVTPSDVGKLNRLVIPKQHAERYFPLDSSSNEKGLLLNFEDRTQKLWRFRYSYWNSSQSYVMTKGWSRFVKDKKLDAGDIVSFQHGVGEAFRERLFIDWRRRPSLVIPSLSLSHDQYYPFHQGNSSSSPLYFRPLAKLTSGHHFHEHHYNNQYHNQTQLLQQGVRGHLYNNINGGGISHPYGAAAVGSSSEKVVYLKSSADESPGSGYHHRMNSMVFDSVNTPKAEGTKKLRLFGVNMECDILPNSDDEMSL